MNLIINNISDLTGHYSMKMNTGLSTLHNPEENAESCRLNFSTISKTELFVVKGWNVFFKLSVSFKSSNKTSTSGEKGIINFSYFSHWVKPKILDIVHKTNIRQYWKIRKSRQARDVRNDTKQVPGFSWFGTDAAGKLEIPTRIDKKGLTKVCSLLPKGQERGQLSKW